MTRPVRRAVLAAAALALLGACAHRPPPEATLTGRLAVRVEGRDDRSFSSGFELQGTAASGRLVLISAVGTTAAQAGWDGRQAWLLTADGRTDYPDLEALAVAALGEPVPIAALFDWLHGRPWSGASHAPLADGTRSFDQLGWRIDLSRHDEGWIEARRDSPTAIVVRARVERS